MNGEIQVYTRAIGTQKVKSKLQCYAGPTTRGSYLEGAWQIMIESLLFFFLYFFTGVSRYLAKGYMTC